MGQLVRLHTEKGSLILLEAPTGFGKSYVAAKLTKKLLADEGKPVIISTHTNKLAYDLEQTAKKLMPQVKIGVVFGKDNYIDLEKLIEKKEALKICCTGVEEYIKTLESSPPEEYWLIDTFIKETLTDMDMEKIVKNMIRTEKRINYAGRFADFDIAVTNHFYLLANFFFADKNNRIHDIETDSGFNPDDFKIILDEVHTVAQTADSLFANSFSPYRFSYLAGDFADSIKNITAKKNVEVLESLAYRMRRIAQDYSRKDLIGEYVKNTDVKYRDFIESLRSVFTLKKYNMSEITKKTNKYISIKPSRTAYDFRDELKELDVVLHSSGLGFLKYSPAKGFPSIIFSRANAGYMLTKMFWKRKPDMIGLSATIRTGKHNEGVQNVLGFTGKIPIPFTLKKIGYSWGRNQRTFIIGKECEPPEPPNIAGDRDIDDKIKDKIKQWSDFIAGTAADTYEGKKSIILTGSYVQVKSIYESLTNLIDKRIVIAAKSDRTASSIMNEYVSEGHIKILVAARHYGTGIDLPGELLEKLYIARLPYPVMTLKWLKKKYLGSEYTDEMIINLRQWMGRLLRTENDKGDLYILDERIHKRDVWERLEGFIKERSIFVKKIEC